MKNILFILLLLFISSSASGQINHQDSTVQVIGYWEKGKMYTYKIKNSLIRQEGGETIASSSVSYNVDITILDSTATSYTIQWEYKDYKIGETNLSDFYPNLFNGLKIIYKTDELGSFEEILNLEDVRNHMAELYNTAIEGINQNGTLDKEEKDKLISMYSSMFLTKDAIESLGIIEIQQFHSFHGGKYKLGEAYEGQTELPNMIGAKPFLADMSIKLSEIYPDESFLIEFVQKIDKDQLKSTMTEYFSKLGGTLESEKNLTDGFNNMDFENAVTVFSVIDNLGWVISSYQEKKVIISTNTSIKEYRIDLLQ